MWFLLLLVVWSIFGPLVLLDWLSTIWTPKEWVAILLSGPLAWLVYIYIIAVSKIMTTLRGMKK
jgi:hypothetical protein